MNVAEARALHDEVPVIDLHADTPKLMDKLRFDISRRHRILDFAPRRAKRFWAVMSIWAFRGRTRCRCMKTGR